MKKRTCIVLLISDQTLPNVMFLKWYFKNHSEEKNPLLLFISTKKMEGSKISDCIISATKDYLIPVEATDYNVLTVNENDYQDSWNVISNFISNHENEIEKTVANITGGTKMMSLGAYAAFSEMENVEIYYQPINEPLRRILPDDESIDVDGSITLKDYFKAYGIDFNYDNKCVKTWGYNQTVYNSILKQHQKEINLLRDFGQYDIWFRGLSNKDKTQNILDISLAKFNVSEKEKSSVVELIKKFEFDPEKLKYSEYFYIIGGWFEECVYQSLLNEDYFSSLENSDEKIAINVEISKNNTKNELDIVYITPDNKLNVIECKSFIKDKSDLLIETIYKIQAIKSNFGINVQSSLYTASKIKSKANIDRAGNFKIKINDDFLGLPEEKKHIISDNYSFKKQFKKNYGKDVDKIENINKRTLNSIGVCFMIEDEQLFGIIPKSEFFAQEVNLTDSELLNLIQQRHLYVDDGNSGQKIYTLKFKD